MKWRCFHSRNSCIGKDLQEAEEVVTAVKSTGCRLSSLDCGKKETELWTQPGTDKRT